MEEVGYVLSAGDGIARIYGLNKVMAGELVELKEDRFGIAMNIEEDSVGVVITDKFEDIKEGDVVKRTGRIASVPVGEELLGRVVNPLGQQ